jgi:hypothetical protein
MLKNNVFWRLMYEAMMRPCDCMVKAKVIFIPVFDGVAHYADL